MKMLLVVLFRKRESRPFIKEKVEFTFYDPKTATDEMVDEIYKTVNDRHRVIRILGHGTFGYSS